MDKIKENVFFTLSVLYQLSYQEQDGYTNASPWCPYTSFAKPPLGDDAAISGTQLDGPAFMPNSLIMLAAVNISIFAEMPSGPLDFEISKQSLLIKYEALSCKSLGALNSRLPNYIRACRMIQHEVRVKLA